MALLPLIQSDAIHRQKCQSYTTRHMTNTTFPYPPCSITVLAKWYTYSSALQAKKSGQLVAKGYRIQRQCHLSDIAPPNFIILLLLSFCYYWCREVVLVVVLVVYFSFQQVYDQKKWSFSIPFTIADESI